jgi:hypothetical protein
MIDIVISKKEAIGFCCDPIPDGWTYTLSQRLSAMLRELEARYGTRDQKWTPLGIEFGGLRPCLWYPGNCGHVSIKLSDSARNNPAQALYQLAHEAVHLLSPTGKRNALVIEEGLATNFSGEIIQRFGINFAEGHAEYVYSKNITQEFLRLHPDGVRLLRQHKPSFCDFTAEMIRETFLDVPIKLATDLCESFADVEARLNPGPPA